MRGQADVASKNAKKNADNIADAAPTALRRPGMRSNHIGPA